MNKSEWQKQQGLDDLEMEKLCEVLRVFDGKIVRIVDNPERRLL